MKSIALGAIVVGFLCLAASAMWQNMFPATTTWTNEKASRSAEVKARIVYLAGFITPGSQRMHGGPDPASAKVEYDALIKENEQLNAEFEGATERPKLISNVLKWTGISLAALGIIGWFAVKES